MLESQLIRRFQDEEPAAPISFEQPDLSVVPEARIASATEDNTGRVITPAIDIKTGKLPNGQDIESFYERGKKGINAKHEAQRALARAIMSLRG